MTIRENVEEDTVNQNAHLHGNQKVIFAELIHV